MLNSRLSWTIKSYVYAHLEIKVAQGIKKTDIYNFIIIYIDVELLSWIERPELNVIDVSLLNPKIRWKKVLKAPV